MTMQVIRKKLTEDAFGTPWVRWNPETDAVEASPDNGVTWNADPGADFRHNIAYQVPPLPPSDNRKCDAATNMVNYLKQYVNAVLEAIGALQLLNTAMGLYLFIFELTNWVLDLLLAIASALATIGKDLIETAFTDSAYTQLKCILLANLAGDGTMTATELTTIKSAVFDQLGATVSSVFNYLSDAFGEVGWSNAGAKGNATGDCFDCSCASPHQYNFALTDGGFLSDTTFEHGASGATYVAGQGWSNRFADNVNGTYIYLSLGAPVTVTSIGMTYSVTSPATSYVIGYALSGSPTNVAVAAAVGGVVSWSGIVTADTIYFQVGNCTSCPSPEGASLITNAQWCEG